jgi:zinc transporter 1/2/3
MRSVQNGTDDNDHDGELLPVWLKLIGAVSCLVLSLILAFIARLRFFEKHPDALSYANIAGGGVILAVAFSHLIPEVQEGFQDLETDYPVGFVLVIAGYVLILLLEKVIFHHGHAHDELPVNSHKHKHQEKSKLLFEEDVDDVDMETQKKNTIITPVALTIALSLHSLFEGIVFGIQSNHGNTLNVMIALISHKPLETLFVGIVMVKERVSLLIFCILTVVVAISTPVGVGIGVAILNDEAPEVMFAVFTALAAGSFIYIATTEIIAEEFQKSRKASVRWTKFFFFLLGVAVILIMKIWLQDPHTSDHDHGDHDHHEECNETDHRYL